MSQYLIEKLAAQFEFSATEKNILAKTKREFSRAERRLYYEKINPHQRRNREFLMDLYEMGGPEERQKWYEMTIESLLEKGGEADLVDELAIEIIGRIDIYSGLRERAEKTGKPIKALAGGGGCFFVLTVGIILITLIVYFLNK